MTVEMTVTRERWRFTINAADPRFPKLIARRLDPEFRPFRCGDDGRSEARTMNMDVTEIGAALG